MNRACPDCDGIKAANATRCMPCERARRIKLGIGGRTSTGSQSINSLSIGRHEAIITFTRGSEITTLHCHGEGSRDQIANGLSRLPGDGWEVQARSTPLTILADLKARELSPKTQLARLEVIRRTERVA